MRTSFAAAALAALVLATPAAAQPDPVELAANLMRVLAEGHPPEVEDYSFTLAYQSERMPVYVRRDGEEWEVVTPEDAPLADFMSMAVFWPALASLAGDLEEESDEAALYVRGDQVEGRPVHVITASGADLAVEGLEVGEMWVDAATYQLLRMHLAGVHFGEEDVDFGSGEVEFTLDMLDHRETEGLVVPGRVRLRLRMEVEMDASERAQMRLGVAMARRQLAEADDPESRQALLMVELFAAILDGEEMDLPMTVEDVRVNPGPPDWLD